MLIILILSLRIKVSLIKRKITLLKSKLSLKILVKKIVAVASEQILNP